MENPAFLKKKFDLHKSPEVQSAANRINTKRNLQKKKELFDIYDDLHEEIISKEEFDTQKKKIIQETKKVPQNPEQQIQNYLDRFSEILDRKNPEQRQQGIEALRKILHKKLVIKDDDINYEYFQQQEQRIAEQQGYGTLDIPSDFNERKRQEIQNDQKHSLDYWINYLSSPDAMYPDWAKYWAFRSMTQMGGYNKEKKAFGKRKKDSAQAFPTLNAGCLAEVVAAVQRKQKNEDLSDLDPEFQKILSTENFSKLYTHALESFGDLKWENLENIRGYWKTYEQGSDATELTDSLAGYPLEWCTRSFDTAQSQLKSGDFHVYYSENSKGEAVVPRLAIRMEHDNIGEIRGIESNQNIDQFIQPVLDEKLEEFGAEGEAYLKKSEDMKRMTEITEKHRTGQKLDKEDLRFLYEVDGKIEGFGYNNDPRIAQALENRDLKEDYGIIYDLDNDVDIANKFIDTGKSQYVIDNYETFEGFILNSEVANKLIDAGQGNDVVEHLEKFQNLDHVDIANRLIDAGEGLAVALSLDRFQGINAETAFKLIEAGKGDAVLIYSRYFEGFTLDNKTALSLIDAKCYLHLLENFEDFQGLDYNYIANKLIEVGEGKILLSYLRKFQGLDYNDIACRLIDLGHANSVLEYIENILDIDSVKIVTKLIDAGKLEEIVKKLGIFSNLNLEIAIKIIETDGLHKILQNIQSFNENDRLEILKKTSEIRPSLLNFYFTKYEEHLIPEQETEILAKIENAKNQ